MTCPHEYVLNDTTVDSVTIPAIAGEMSVLSGTVPTITELNAGVVSVKALDGNVSRYFVSPGFALKSKDNVLTVSVAEAFPVEDLDPEAVSQVSISLFFFLPFYFSKIFFSFFFRRDFNSGPRKETPRPLLRRKKRLQLEFSFMKPCNTQSTPSR